MKKKNTKYLLFLALVAFMFVSCSNSNTKSKKIDIYDVVKEAYLTEDGYSDDLSKHMTEDMFKKINIFDVLSLDNIEYSNPLDINFRLYEDSQEVKKDIIYVNMVYSVVIKDSEGKDICGAVDTHVTFQVKESENGWYIIEKDEQA